MKCPAAHKRQRVDLAPACRYDYCYRDDYEHNYGWCYTVRLSSLSLSI
jgi:hypothetical protein